jgi:O-antigen ligase
MSRFGMRRRAAANPDAPASRGLIITMLGVILALGYVVTAEVEIPSIVLGAVGMIAMAGLLMAGLRRPELPIYVMVAYLPFSKLLTGDFGGIMTALNLTNILLVTIMVCWFANTATEGKAFFEPHALHVPVLLLTGWMFVSYGHEVIDSGPGYAFRYLDNVKRWLDPIVLYFLFFHIVKDLRRWKTIVIIIMIGVTIAAAMAVHEYEGVRTGSSLARSRVGGIAGQPNILGAFFVYYMFLFAAFWLERAQDLRRWWLLVPFLLCFRGIMVTFSRGAYLAFAQGLLGLAYFKNKALFVVAVISLAFVAVNPWLLPEGIRYRLGSTFKGGDVQLTDPYGGGIAADIETEVDLSAGTRIVVWRGAMELIKEHPWVGVGVGRFSFAIMRFVPLEKRIDAHNAYLVTAAEMGIPALVFFLLVILAIFRVTSVVFRRHPDPFVRAAALGFLGGLSGLLMANMFGSRLNTSEVSGYFWILAALMARAHRWVRQDVAQARAQRRKERADALRFSASPHPGRRR